MRTIGRLFYIFAVLLVMLPFQNCSPSRSFNSSLLFSSNDKSGDSGNGGGYEGKPDGTYYRFTPSYTCEGQASAEQITEIKNGQGYLYVNSDNQCANQSTPISAADMNISPFQNEFISVKDLLFKRYDEKPAGIPNKLAEVLCRDDFENPTFEIVSHYDREQNEALARIYFLDQQISDFSVGRILSSSQVRYVADQISFQVDLSKPAFAERKFAGKIESSKISKLSSQALVCVIGGSIDTSKWNLKSLTQVDAGPFQLMKNNEILFFSEVSRYYFSPTLYSYVTHLFKVGLDNLVSDFSKVTFGENYEVLYNNGNAGDVLNLFSAKLTSEAWPSLFFYDSRTGKSKRLTNLVKGAEPEAYTLATPVLTADQYLFFDTQIIHSSGGRTAAVRVYDFNTDKIEQIAALGEGFDSGYSVLRKKNQLLIYWNEKAGLKNVIEIYDASSKATKNLKVSMPNDCSISGYRAEAVSDEAAIVVSQVCQDGKNNVVQVDLINGQVKVLGLDSIVSWVSEDHNRFVLTDSLKNNSAYDYRNELKTNLPIDPRFGVGARASGLTDLSLVYSKMALAKDRYLYGFGGSESNPSMYQVDLQTGTSTVICESALGKKLYLGILPDQKVFLFTYDLAVKTYRFYQVRSATDCRRINEFPSLYPDVPRVTATNIGFGLLLGDPLVATSNIQTPEAVFVPIDGRPPLKFNSNAKANWEMQVSADKKRIVLRGPDTNGVVRIFSFDL